MQYWMMRLFLSDRYKGTLFDFDGKGPRESREDFLRRWFSQEIKFSHRRKTYVYTPFKSESGNQLLGLIAREHKVTIGSPPEQKYQKRDISDWDTANVFIDTSGTSDGQKIAMQDDPVIGKPLPVFQSLVSRINLDPDGTEWVIAVNTISSSEGFWEAAAQYSGRITEIDLKFAAPNIWGGDSETEKALKELHAQNGVNETEVKLKSISGPINPGNSQSEGRIPSSVKFITRGGGSLRLKAGRKVVFDTKSSVTKAVPEEDFAVQDTEIAVVSALAKWLLSK